MEEEESRTDVRLEGRRKRERGVGRRGGREAGGEGGRAGAVEL